MLILRIFELGNIFSVRQNWDILSCPGDAMLPSLKCKAQSELSLFPLVAQGDSHFEIFLMARDTIITHVSLQPRSTQDIN